ncbi:unnamed protein product [Onchocerca flexuosa]|uniref:Uncharacterized protein n=1 Tax=Onchocerca flexuosa TaxID=387005 RepID=A0A183H554_9BILA|nr:unnamed protein product [Onchocerca flexuosa]
MASELSKSATFHNFCDETNVLSPLPSQAPTPNTFASWIQFFLLRKRHSTIGRQIVLRPSVSLYQVCPSRAVVDETKALGSDGESIEVSPCSSDQCANQSDRHVINVKMRQKPTRRWNEWRTARGIEQ